MKIERHDFLVELGTEELPPKALRGLEEAFASGVRTGLDKVFLEHGDVVSYATPRRLAVWVKKLAARQPEQDLKRRGPPVNASFDAAGAPTRAALAFAESCGTTVDALQRLDEGKGTFLFFIGKKAGRGGDRSSSGHRQGGSRRIADSEAHALGLERRRVCAAGSLVAHVVWEGCCSGNPARHGVRESHAGHRFHAPKPIRITTPAQLCGRVE